MNIPERELNDQARARRRAELVEAIDADGLGRGGRPRRGWAAPLAAAAAVAVVGGTAYVATTAGGEDSPSGDSSQDVPVAGGGGTAPGTPEGPCAWIDELDRMELDDPTVMPVLQGYRDVLARHLDPQNRHLQRKATGLQYGANGKNRCSLGTKLSWTTPGEEGMGMLQVEVGTEEPRHFGVWMEHDGWQSRSVTRPGVSSVSTVDYGDGLAVAVTRDDGVTVVVNANLLFGNNSLVPIDDFPITIEDLIETAVDPEFALPTVS